MPSSEPLAPRPPLGPYALSNSKMLALKAAAACALALVLAQLVGCPDLVSSTFVAVLCTSPTVLSGIFLGFSQVAGSVLGGGIGSAMLFAGVPLELGIPLAVALSIQGCFWIQYPNGYPVAAFSALFVQAIPRGSPLETLGVRLLAVGIAVVASTLVNFAFSGRSYRGIFRRRLKRAEEWTDQCLEELPQRGAKSVTWVLPGIDTLSNQVRSAEQEAILRGRELDQEWLQEIRIRAETLEDLMHLIYHFGLVLEEERHPKEVGSLVWAALRDPQGILPELPPELEPAAHRLEAHWRAFQEQKRRRSELATTRPKDFLGSAAE